MAVFGPYTLEAGQSWYFWFYLGGGDYGGYSTNQYIEEIPQDLYIVARPALSNYIFPGPGYIDQADVWDLQTIETRVVLEAAPFNAPDLVTDYSRYSYRVLIKNSNQYAMSFFISVHVVT